MPLDSDLSGGQLYPLFELLRGPYPLNVNTCRVISQVLCSVGGEVHLCADAYHTREVHSAIEHLIQAF